MSLLVRIDAEIERRSLLKHPFYRNWADGALTRSNLAGYSMEYFQLVKAVPDLVSSVASFANKRNSAEINANVEEEKTHVDPWVKFAGSLGVSKTSLEAYHGAAETLHAVETLRELAASSFEEGVGALYAYEKQLPDISRSKIMGLKKHYGLKGGDATRYFELHEEADVRHAALWRSYLSRSKAPETKVLRSVVGSLVAQNALLDSVMSNHC